MSIAPVRAARAAWCALGHLADSGARSRIREARELRRHASRCDLRRVQIERAVNDAGDFGGRKSADVTPTRC